MSTMTRVGFSTCKGNIVSAIIRWFTKSKVSHCFLVYFDVDFGRDMIMEATDGGFKILPLDKYSKGVSFIQVFEPKQSIDPGLQAAVDWLGESYDYTGLFGMAFVMLGRWLKRKWKNPLHSSNAMFCSTAVTLALQAAKYPDTKDFDPDTTTPEDLYELFLKG